VITSVITSVIKRKLTTSLLCFSLLPSLVMAAGSGVVVYRADGSIVKPQLKPLAVSANEQTAYERIFWNKTPLSVTLQTGRERLIHFPDMVRVKPPKVLSSEQLKITVVDNVVYLKALKDFSVERMKVQAFNHISGSFEGGRFYLLDLSAKRNGGIEQIQIIDKTNSNQSSLMQSAQSEGGSEQSDGMNASQSQAVDMVALVRYAAQQLYAPERLVQSHPAIYRTPLRVKSLTSLYRGGELRSIPLASWKGGDLYLTAVKIQNKTTLPVILDPRLFRGQWRSRTLQHGSLSRYHTEADTSTVYLVSARPFHESLWF